MSRSTPPASGADTDKVITINWRLLGRRLWLRSSQLFTSARHRAAHTEYIPPSWMGRLRLTWFRIGLIGLAIFVFSQKQIDVTVSMGAEGVGVSTAGMTAPRDADPASQTTTLSMLPGSSTASTPAAPTWTVRRYEEQAVRRYVERFTRVARTEEEKYAIPAAAKMAMALLDSEAGTAAVARQDNNHFRTAAGDQRFDNAWSSWRDHSEYISRRFPELASESVNHQQWIAALGRSGYSRDPQYTQKLLRLIEHFDLDWL